MRTWPFLALLCSIAGQALAAPDLPPALKATGTLKVAVGNRSPPLGFHDPATDVLTGFDVDLGQALAARLGVRVEWLELAGFQTMMLALQTGRADAAIGGIADIDTRHATASFVDYIRSGAQFFVQRSRAGEFPDQAALCGHTVGASSLTYFPDDVAEWSAQHCGDRPVRLVGADGSGQARSQLKQGRIDAAVQGSEALPYLMASEPGAYAPVGPPLRPRYDGIAVPKHDEALQTALAGALDTLIADGTYGALLAKWHLEANAVDAATINAGR